MLQPKPSAGSLKRATIFRRQDYKTLALVEGILNLRDDNKSMRKTARQTALAPVLIAVSRKPTARCGEARPHSDEGRVIGPSPGWLWS